MTVTSRFFSNGNSYNQPDFAKLMKDAVGSGVVPGIEDELEVVVPTPNAMAVIVSKGRAYLNGYSVDIEDSAERLVITSADTLPRIDLVVARLSVTTTRNILFAVKKGTPASTPVAPSVETGDETYELALAEVYVGSSVSSIYSDNITDKRTYCNNPLGNVREVYLNGTQQPVVNNMVNISIPDATSTESGLARCGEGLTSSDGIFNLNVGSATNLGGYKVGSGLSVSSSGVLSCNSSIFVDVSSVDELESAFNLSSSYRFVNINLAAGTYNVSNKNFRVSNGNYVGIIPQGNVTFTGVFDLIIEYGGISEFWTGYSLSFASLVVTGYVGTFVARRTINITASGGVSFTQCNVMVNNITYTSSSFAHPLITSKFGTNALINTVAATDSTAIDCLVEGTGASMTVIGNNTTGCSTCEKSGGAVIFVSSVLK